MNAEALPAWEFGGCGWSGVDGINKLERGKENMPPKRAHLLISGRVQGVSFRYYTRQQAISHGLRGWVRNLVSGEVETVFEGEEENVQKMLDWCREGPPAARVEHVHLDWETPTGNPDGFDIRSTGGRGEWR